MLRAWISTCRVSILFLFVGMIIGRSEVMSEVAPSFVSIGRWRISRGGEGVKFDSVWTMLHTMHLRGGAQGWAEPPSGVVRDRDYKKKREARVARGKALKKIDKVDRREKRREAGVKRKRLDKRTRLKLKSRAKQAKALKAAGKQAAILPDNETMKAPVEVMCKDSQQEILHSPSGVRVAKNSAVLDTEGLEGVAEDLNEEDDSVVFYDERGNEIPRKTARLLRAPGHSGARDRAPPRSEMEMLIQHCSGGKLEPVVDAEGNVDWIDRRTESEIAESERMVKMRTNEEDIEEMGGDAAGKGADRSRGPVSRANGQYVSNLQLRGGADNEGGLGWAYLCRDRAFPLLRLRGGDNPHGRVPAEGKEMHGQDKKRKGGEVTSSTRGGEVTSGSHAGVRDSNRVKNQTASRSVPSRGKQRNLKRSSSSRLSGDKKTRHTRPWNHGDTQKSKKKRRTGSAAKTLQRECQKLEDRIAEARARVARKLEESAFMDLDKGYGEDKVQGHSGLSKEHEHAFAPEQEKLGKLIARGAGERKQGDEVKGPHVGKNHDIRPGMGGLPPLGTDLMSEFAARVQLVKGVPPSFPAALLQQIPLPKLPQEDSSEPPTFEAQCGVPDEKGRLRFAKVERDVDLPVPVDSAMFENEMMRVRISVACPESVSDTEANDEKAWQKVRENGSNMEGTEYSPSNASGYEANNAGTEKGLPVQQSLVKQGSLDGRLQRDGGNRGASVIHRPNVGGGKAKAGDIVVGGRSGASMSEAMATCSEGGEFRVLIKEGLHEPPAGEGWDVGGTVKIVGGASRQRSGVRGPVRLGRGKGDIECLVVTTDLDPGLIGGEAVVCILAGEWGIRECDVSGAQRDSLCVTGCAVVRIEGCSVGGLGPGIRQCKACVRVGCEGSATLRQSTLSDGAVGLCVEAGGKGNGELCTVQRSAVGLVLGGGSGLGAGVVAIERWTFSANRLAAWQVQGTQETQLDLKGVQVSSGRAWYGEARPTRFFVDGNDQTADA